MEPLHSARRPSWLFVGNFGSSTFEIDPFSSSPPFISTKGVYVPAQANTPPTPTPSSKVVSSPLQQLPATLQQLSVTPQQNLTPPSEDYCVIPSCQQCKGNEYDFTKYFHNTQIFAVPPHSLIGFVEAAYVQRKHLKDILQKYAIQDLQKESSEGVESELKNWVYNVDALIADVRLRARETATINGALDQIYAWAEEMGKLLLEHVTDVRAMPMPTGKVKELLVGFRKTWERVWFACVQEDGISTREITDVSMPSLIVWQ